MITAIFVNSPTTLTFATSEELVLEEMAQPSRRTPLIAGQDTPVEVGSGVFKVHSKRPVAVSASTAAIGVAVTPNDKDGGIDPPKLLTPMAQLIPGLDIASAHRFLFTVTPALDAAAPT
jgi:hypothetical protein